MKRPLLAVMGLVFIAASPAPVKAPPVFELHRAQPQSGYEVAKADPLFILVIGSDVREGDPAAGRADSIHLVAVNQRDGHGTIIGIPRDSYVSVPGVGNSKINDALKLGGNKLAETVRVNTGLPVHYWVLSEFTRFRNLVDALGGMDMDIPYPMHDGFSGANFDPGRRHLNGHEALAFARTRYATPNGDISRSENQGQMLLAGLAKMRAEASTPLGMFRYLEAFRSQVVTDVPLSDLLALGTLAVRLDGANFRNVVVPVRYGQEGSQSVVYIEASARSIYDAVRDDGKL